MQRRDASPRRALSYETARSIWSDSASAISPPIGLWNNCGEFKRRSSAGSSCSRTCGQADARRVRRRRRRGLSERREGIAAYALVETASGQLVWSTTVRRRVVFPYITTYLSFREIPILLDLLDEVRSAGRMAEVLLVDGSGILHHRHAGIASHLGVVAGCQRSE